MNQQQVKEFEEKMRQNGWHYSTVELAILKEAPNISIDFLCRTMIARYKSKPVINTIRNFIYAQTKKNTKEIEYCGKCLNGFIYIYQDNDRFPIDSEKINELWMIPKSVVKCNCTSATYSIDDYLQNMTQTYDLKTYELKYLALFDFVTFSLKRYKIPFEQFNPFAFFNTRANYSQGHVLKELQFFSKLLSNSHQIEKDFRRFSLNKMENENVPF